jgi:hypothetical protein
MFVPPCVAPGSEFVQEIAELLLPFRIVATFITTSPFDACSDNCLCSLGSVALLSLQNPWPNATALVLWGNSAAPTSHHLVSNVGVH